MTEATEAQDEAAETRMRQWAPYPEALQSVVDRLEFMPGWRFRLHDLQRDTEVPAGGLTLSIYVTGPNSYAEDENISVVHYFIVPAATYDGRAWTRWVLDRCIDVLTHEVRASCWVCGCTTSPCRPASTICATWCGASRTCCPRRWRAGRRRCSARCARRCSPSWTRRRPRACAPSAGGSSGLLPDHRRRRALAVRTRLVALQPPDAAMGRGTDGMGGTSSVIQPRRSASDQ